MFFNALLDAGWPKLMTKISEKSKIYVWYCCKTNLVCLLYSITFVKMKESRYTQIPLWDFKKEEDKARKKPTYF